MNTREITKFLTQRVLGVPFNVFCKGKFTIIDAVIVRRIKRGEPRELVEVKLQGGYTLYRKPRSPKGWLLRANITTFRGRIEIDGAKVTAVGGARIIAT